MVGLGANGQFAAAPAFQVAHKWLKDRKGRLLTFDELQHYGRIISALNETIRIQSEIDAVLGVGRCVIDPAT